MRPGQNHRDLLCVRACVRVRARVRKGITSDANLCVIVRSKDDISSAKEKKEKREKGEKRDAKERTNC
jgi:hypothetical protein